MINYGYEVENLGHSLIKLTDEAQVELAKYMRQKDELNQRLDKYVPQIEINQAISEMLTGFVKQRKIAEEYEQQIRNFHRQRDPSREAPTLVTPHSSFGVAEEESQSEFLPDYLEDDG